MSLAATLVFAHSLTPANFGVLAAFWLVWILMMSMNRSVLAEQLIVSKIRRTDVSGYREFSAIWLTVSSLLSVAAAVLLDRATIVPGVLFMALFVASDSLRYEHIADVDSKPYLPSVFVSVDSLRLVFSVLSLAFLGLGLEVGYSYYAICASAGVWVVVSICIQRSFVLSRGLFFLRTRAKFERQLSLQFLLSAATSQGAPLLSIIAFGPASLGAIRLGQSLLSPINLLTTAFLPSLIRKFAGFRDRAPGELGRIIFLSACFSLAGAIALVVVVMLLMYTYLDLLVPYELQGQFTQVALPIAVQLAAAVVSMPSSATVKSFRLGRISLVSQFIAGVTTLVLCGAALSQSLTTFVWAIAVGAWVNVAANYFGIWRHLGKGRGVQY